ncbi:MAG: hypothetical protein U0930_20040 [Pirellulales bacterium]
MRDQKPIVILICVLLLAIAVCLSAWWIADAQVAQAAMANGYEQVITADGDIVWRKRPGERFAKVVKWLVEIAAEFF